MSANKVVVGVFSYLDDTLKAIKQVQQQKLEYRVYSPVPNHEIEELTLPGRSPVRFITATGAVTGLTFGFGLAIFCSADWPLRTSAKAVISIPAFFPIGYECTILFGAIFTLISLLHFCRIPDLLRKTGYDPRFSGSKFGVAVGCDGKKVEDVKRRLLESGADEVEVREGL